eukprot:1160231-Amphidinium_carterae.1
MEVSGSLPSQSNAGLVTVLCNVDCLGAMASFWAPCRGMRQFQTNFVTTFKSPTDGRNIWMRWDLWNRSDVCGLRWHMNRRKCMEATLEHLVWLLYPKVAHLAFTIAAFQIVKA